MNIFKDKIKIFNLVVLCTISVLYYTFNFRIVKGTFFDNDFYNSLLRIKLICYIILLIAIVYKIINNNYSLKEIWFIDIILPTIFLLNMSFSLLDFKIENISNGIELEFFTYLLLNIVLKDISYRKIIKSIFIIFMILSIAIVLLVLYSFAYNDVTYRGMSFRYTIGALWAAHFGYVILYLSIYYIYIRREQVKNHELILIILLNLIIFCLTKTRHSFSLFLILIIFWCYMIKTKNVLIYYKQYGILLKIFVILLPISFMILVYFYDGNIVFMSELNKILSTRLALTNRAIMDYKIHFFPVYYEYSSNPNNYNVVDSSFVRFILNYGVVGFVILICFLEYFAHLIVKSKDLYMTIIFIISLVHMTFNVDLFTMCYCNLLFIWSYMNSITEKQ